MNEYAALAPSGEIVTIITTPRSLSQVQKGFRLDVVPLSQVPQAVQERYQYWDERP